MKTLGIIPARGGSKRVPHKNIRLLAGTPLIAYTIRAAQLSKMLDQCIVSTDSEEIAEVALIHGADVPFLRPKDLAGDTSPDQPVLLHALRFMIENRNFKPDIVLNLRPTSPLKTPEIIDRVIHAFDDQNVDIVRTMTKVEGVHHPYWMYNVADTGEISPFINGVDIRDYYQSQLLPPAYRINGVVDAYRSDIIETGNILSSRNMKAVIIDENESFDIDTEFDFKMCETLLGRF